METALLSKTSTEFSQYDDIFNYQAPFLEEKLIRDGKISSKEEYESAFLELKKYFILNEKTGKSLGMASKTVDEVWHQFILFTREYHKFCNKFFGKYIHHSPNTSFTPVSESGVDSFVNSYLEEFGKIPTIWGALATVACENSDGGSGCTGCNTCSQGQRTKIKNSISELGCKECNGCGTGTPSCEP